MDNYWLTEAVSNNAAWCDAMAASHDIKTYRDGSIWCSEYPMPSFYPNIVTLRRDVVIDETIDRIVANLPSGWGVKDSFSELSLEGMGFNLAFVAHWYRCLPNHCGNIDNLKNVRVKTVKSDTDLIRWVEAWGDGNEIFTPSLLKNCGIELLYVERNGEVVSGMATNQSEGSIGISNSFGREGDLLGCVATVKEKHPQKGIVGYGDKTEIGILSKVGFEEIGDLKIWLRR
jgi:hypothetical protein